VIAIRPNGSTWTPDYITINTQPFVNKKTDGLDSSVILQRLYTIKHSAALQNPVDVRLYYSQAEIDSQVPFAKYPMQGWFKHSGVKGDVEADLTPRYLLSTNAIVLSPSETGTEFGLQYVQFNGIATFSTIGYTGNTSESILPVELVSFTAYRKGTTAVLDWYTASEVNNAGFEVQHSLDGVNFTPIGWVAGNGNSSVPHSYQFVHENLTEGVHYYRLKQVDFNGASELSKIISLSYEASGVVRVYPVPAKSEVYIQNGESYVSMRLMDASGRVVKSTMLNRQNLQKVDVSNLAQGAYMIVLEKADGSMETLKIMIQ
jgi:hypothetical protein